MQHTKYHPNQFPTALSTCSNHDDLEKLLAASVIDLQLCPMVVHRDAVTLQLIACVGLGVYIRRDLKMQGSQKQIKYGKFYNGVYFLRHTRFQSISLQEYIRNILEHIMEKSHTVNILRLSSPKKMCQKYRRASNNSHASTKYAPISSNYRYICSSNPSQSPRVAVTQNVLGYSSQELCLDNNKWLIFDENRQIKQAQIMKQSTKKRQLGGPRKVKPVLKDSSVSQKIKKSNIKSVKGRILTRVQIQANNNKCLDVVNQSKMPDPQKIEYIKRINFTHDVLSCNEDRLHSQSNNGNNSGLHQPHLSASKKASKSIKSVKSSKSFKSTKRQRSQKHSNSKTPLKKDQIINFNQNQNQEKGQTLPEIGQARSLSTEQQRLVQIAQLFNPIHLLEKDIFSRPFTSNPYEDFSQWNQCPLKMVPFNVQNEHGSLEVLNRSDGYDYMKKFSLPVDLQELKNQQNSSNLLFCSKNLKGQQMHENADKETIQPLNQHKINCFQSDQTEIYEIKQRCITTKATQIPLNSCESYKNDDIFQLTPISQGSKEGILTLKLTNFYASNDIDFNIRQQFSQEQNIVLIDIRPSQQTALFPINIHKPIYIQPYSSHLQCKNDYSNSQIIAILNLFLKVKPEYLQNMIQNPMKNRYYCKLYHQKIVEVDGLFPFDKNYYPLFGGVQQYIWFGVMMKSIAKLKGSYKAIKNITFNQMYQIITNDQLENINVLLKQSEKPLKLLKIFQKYNKIEGSYIIVKNGNQFYKIQSMSYVKSLSEQRQELQKVFVDNNCRNLPQKNLQQSYKSLTSFLRKKRQQICQQRIKGNTIVTLLGAFSTKKIPFVTLLEQFQVYSPKRANQKVADYLRTASSKV